MISGVRTSISDETIMDKEKQVSISKITIRKAGPQDVQDVARLLVAAYSEYEKYLSPERWEWYRSDLMDVSSRMADAEIIIAENRGEIAGSVTLFLNGADHGWPEGWAGIRLLAVHPDYRERGIGKQLMQECVRRCREKGIKTIGLHTTELMKVARGMYERMGFKHVPEFDFHPEPGRVVYAYRLDL